MGNFTVELFNIKPRFEKAAREKIIERYSRTRGTLEDRPVFSQNWQPFAWAAVLGFINNRKRPLSSPLGEPFGDFGIINNNGRLIANALICLALSKSETGAEILKDPKGLVTIIEEYANGGFDHIMENLDEKGESYFDSFDNFLVEALKRNNEY